MATVAMAVTTYEMEITAPSINEAAASVVETLRSKFPAKIRNDHIGYSREYIEPDWSRYAAASDIRMRHPEDVAGGVDRAHKGFRKMPPVAIMEPPAGVEHTPYAAAQAAINTYVGRRGLEVVDSGLQQVLYGLLEYSEAQALDFYNLLSDFKEDILHNKPSNETQRPSFV